MASKDYTEIFCQATELLAQHLIDKVSFDKTITCTIIDDSNKENGKYKVSDGSVGFEAHTEDTSLKKGDNVYVQIPNGDWNEQKIIISKKLKDKNTPITYKDPFESYVNITNNIIHQNMPQQSLIANGKVDHVLLWTYNIDTENIKDKPIISSNGTNLEGYTRLAIRAEFQSWLKDFKTVMGDYGLRLIFEIEQDNPDDENNSENKNIKACFLDCGDMLGNPYNFEGFHVQKKVFDISNFNKIKSIQLYFYQNSDFRNINGDFIPPKNFSEEEANVIPPNLFVKDIIISLGYDAEEFKEDAFILYSSDSQKYSSSTRPLYDNHKKLQFRWIHKFEDGTVKVVEETDKIEYTINLYKYNLGSKSHTIWSGVDWSLLSSQEYKKINDNKEEKWEFSNEIHDKDWTDYNKAVINGLDANNASTSSNNDPVRNIKYNQAWLLPDINKSEEKIKGIIQYNNKQIYSNVLIFSNENEVINNPSVQAAKALSINCEDGSFGNYFIYNIGGGIVENGAEKTVREFKAYLDLPSTDKEQDNDSPAELKEGQSITWIIPIKNTMIDIEDLQIGTESEDGRYIRIVRNGAKQDDGTYDISNQNTQRYRVKKQYDSSKTNNTIQCIVKRDGIEYIAQKELSFGPAGTSGTDYTFVLDFIDPNNAALTTPPKEENGERNGEKEYVEVEARLYNYQGNEVDITGKKITWSIVNSNNQIVIGQKQKNKVELQLKDSVKTPPEDNYNILMAKLEDWGDYELKAYLPIPIRLNSNYKYIEGATTILYNSLGHLDNKHYKDPYAIYYIGNKENEKYELIRSLGDEWNIKSANDPDPYKPVLSKDGTGGYKITPINFYVKGSMDKICLTCKIGGETVWSQPIFCHQNKYFSSIIDKWDGQLKIDNENNAILAAKIAAGKKNDDNTFSGVIMGDWNGEDVEGEITENTGIYGFNRGSASFGFRDDGTAFIGKPGAGRLEFDGNKSVIESNRMAEGLGGLKLDFDDGLIEMKNPINYQVELVASNWKSKKQVVSVKGLVKDEEIILEVQDSATDAAKKAFEDSKCTGSVTKNDTVTFTCNTVPTVSIPINIIKKSGSIILKSADPITPFKIGTNFSVDWDGTLNAKNGIFEGEITSDKGHIGGWTIGGKTLSSKNNSLVLDSSDGSITGGILRGSAQIGDETTNPIVLQGYFTLNNLESNSYLGYLPANLIDDAQEGGDDEAPGIGFKYVDGKIEAKVKATGANSGLSFKNGSSGGWLSITDTSFRINHNKKIIITAGTGTDTNDGAIEFVNIPAKNQKGIYARFA